MIKVKYGAGGEDVVEFSTYPDGTFYTKWRPCLPDVRAVEFQGTTVDEMMRALFLVDALNERGFDVDEFIIPFIPGGRQDRLNDEGDFLFTALSVADIINFYEFKRVVTCDPHSHFTVGEIDNLWIDNEVDFAAMWKGRYTAVVAPDKGAGRRAANVASALGVPVYQADKTRDVATGALTGFVWPEEAQTGRFLIVDDICDGGGTFLGLLDESPHYCQVDLYVTHGLFTKGVEALTGAFGNVYTRFLYGAWETITPKGVRLVGETTKEN